MTRNYVSILFLLLANIAVGQEIKIGEQVPAFTLELVNNNQLEYSFDGSNQAILIDFWATWCSPCVDGMPHLERLQNKFGSKLQVISVSEEKHERISRFHENRPYKFLFARDTGILRSFFPYQIIPHSILIDPNGTVVAITSPEHITEQVIEQLLAGKKISLPTKEDHFDFDPGHEYFDFDEEAQKVFQLQPYMSGIPTFSITYNEGAFKQRRITLFNFSIAGLYRIAYRTSVYRLIYEFDESLIDWDDENNRYCLNAIAKSPEELYPFLKEQLREHTEVMAQPSTSELKALVIKKSEEGIKATRVQAEGTAEARGDGYKNEGASISDFCEYLEQYGIVGMAVIDKTGDDKLYDLDFSFDPENDQSFRDAMASLGLTYSVEVLKTEVLVLTLKEEY